MVFNFIFRCLVYVLYFVGLFKQIKRVRYQIMLVLKKWNHRYFNHYIDKLK